MTDETKGNDKVKAAEAISIGFVEKAWEFKWGIQLVYIALYSDAVLAWFLHRNLLSVTSDSTQIWGSVGGLLIAAAGFCLTVSLIIPIVSGLLTAIIIEYSPNWLINAFNERSQRPHEVSLHYLHTEALRTQNEFLMAIYRDKNSSWIRRFSDHQQANTLMCGLALLLVADAWAGYASGTQTLLVWLAEGHEVLFYLCLAPTAAMLLISTILKPYPRSDVYHPALREQQDQERDEMYGRNGETR